MILMPALFRASLPALQRALSPVTLKATSRFPNSAISSLPDGSPGRLQGDLHHLVEGVLPPKGTVDAPIARAEGSTIEREINFETGERAVTHYERLALGKQFSLAELHLETGRTHQIRVHMKYIGHPLPGDYLYNPVYDRISRQPLHSFQLEFTHPITKKALIFTAPLPSDFRNAF